MEPGKKEGFRSGTGLRGQRLGLRVRGRGGRSGQEWKHERLVKIVALAKLFELVRIVFAEEFLADQVEDDMADVLAGVDVPVAEHGRDHRPEFLERKEADAVEELAGGDVDGDALLDLLLLLDGEVQGIADEGVNVAMITRVLRDDAVHCLRKANFLHAIMGEKPSLQR